MKKKIILMLIPVIGLVYSLYVWHVFYSENVVRRRLQNRTIRMLLVYIFAFILAFIIILPLIILGHLNYDFFNDEIAAQILAYVLTCVASIAIAALFIIDAYLLDKKIEKMIADEHTSNQGE